MIARLFIITLLLLQISFAIQLSQLKYFGKISCKTLNGTTSAEYEIFQLTKGNTSPGGTTKLGEFWKFLGENYWISQSKPGKCSVDYLFDISLTEPVDPLLLIKSFIEILNLKYVINGNLDYTPSAVLINKEDISFTNLLDFLYTSYIRDNNKDLKISFNPQNNLLILDKFIGAKLTETSNEKNKCVEPILTNYADLKVLNKKDVYQRYVIKITPEGVNLEPYYKCKNDTKQFVYLTRRCPSEAYLGFAYLDNISLLNLLKFFEKVYRIHFVFNPEEIINIKHSQNLHLAFDCFNLEKALEFLKKNYHLHIEKISENTFRIFANRDAYSVLLNKVSDYETKILYLKNITVREFVKLLELYYGDKVIYNADPIFGAVTVIAPPDIIQNIIKNFGVYLRYSQSTDRLISKIYYIKYGNLQDIIDAIKEYLSDKGKVQSVQEAKAIEIMDYPTNISIIEKVFGNFLSQKPVKIKVVAKFIRINKSFARSLGINWDFTYGSPSNAESVSSWTVQQNQGALTSNISFIYKKFNTINLTISAGETLGLSKVLSSPSLILLSDQTGNISFGTQIPYQSVDENGNPKTELVSATLTLNVTPKLLPDGRILLNLQLSNNAPNTALAVNGQPAIDTFTIQQNFIISDGDTIVIGGVLKKEKEEGENGVPILRRVPLLGWLFKNKNWTNSDTELFVVITAQVVSE